MGFLFITVQPKSSEWCEQHQCNVKDCTVASDGFGINGGICGIMKISSDRCIHECEKFNCGSSHVVCFPCTFTCSLCITSCGILASLCAPCCATCVIGCYNNETNENATKYKWCMDMKKYTKGIWFGSGNHRNPH